MKWIKRLICCILFLFISLPNIKAKEPIQIYLFYSELCSTCQAEEKWLEQNYQENENIKIILLEVTRNEENAKLLTDVRTALKNNELTTPYTVIGTTGITGFSDTVANQIQATVHKYSNQAYVDIVDVVKNKLDVDYTIDHPEGEYKVPLLGNIDPKTVSLPLISIIIGFIDGFNPCAMWVLLFLISMLLNMKNRRKMWTLGITFLITSALVYLAFMLAWLQIAINLTSIAWVRFIIAIIAFIGGMINLTSFVKERKKDNGCEIVDDKKRKSIFKKMKQIISRIDNNKNHSFLKREGSFLFALIGIIGLAISVNLVELACSSGLPLVFTQILALNELGSLQYILYLLLYIFFFLIDDVVIFIIAMKTLKVTGISTKYNKLSHLIGGIVMILIGILMIFKPEWLMFNF